MSMGAEHQNPEQSVALLQAELDACRAYIDTLRSDVGHYTALLTVAVEALGHLSRYALNSDDRRHATEALSVLSAFGATS